MCGVVGRGCNNLTLWKKVGREGESSLWRMLTRFRRSALAAMLLDHEATVVRVRAGRMLQDVEIVLFLSSALPFFSNSSIETFKFYFLKKKILGLLPGGRTWWCWPLMFQKRGRSRFQTGN